MSTKETILQKASQLFAENGYDIFSMRILAESIPLAPSVLYHHFKDKDDLLKAMFDYVNTSLGKKREALPSSKSASEMLKQRISFQLDNAQEIVAVLKYFIAYRKKFHKFKGGFTPDKSSLHMEEVLDLGIKTGEFYSKDVQKDAKVMTHAVNGFLLEYYPDIPKTKEKTMLVENIYKFLIRALLKGGEQNENNRTNSN
jgi:AcrR family transcriptional regulator